MHCGWRVHAIDLPIFKQKNLEHCVSNQEGISGYPLDFGETLYVVPTTHTIFGTYITWLLIYNHKYFEYLIKK